MSTEQKENTYFLRENLEDFKMNNFSFPKTMQIVPCFHIIDREEVFIMLLLNKNDYLCDFGSSFNSSTMSLENYIVDSLKTKSLDIILTDGEYLKQHSYVAYKKNFDDNSIISTANVKLPLPIIFVDFYLQNISKLDEILINFKGNFAQNLNNNFRTVEIHNLVYLSAIDIFYISRNTDYKIFTEENEEIIIDIQSNGFPAKQNVTEIYKINGASGDIPFDNHYNEYANCCPEVNFYYSRSEDLSRSLLEFFDSRLEIIT